MLGWRGQIIWHMRGRKEPCSDTSKDHLWWQRLIWQLLLFWPNSESRARPLDLCLHFHSALSLGYPGGAKDSEMAIYPLGPSRWVTWHKFQCAVYCTRLGLIEACMPPRALGTYTHVSVSRDYWDSQGTCGCSVSTDDLRILLASPAL